MTDHDSWLIKGVMTPGGDGPTSILLSGGSITDIGPDLEHSGARALDADGLIALPGLVDLHTHLREPGREDAETVQTGTAAAALGGFTAVHAMANTDPVADTAGVVEQVWRLGRAAGHCDVQPVGAVTIGLTSNPRTPITQMARISIVTPTGPEVITGSTRMKAGTATKLVLNMLSTATFIRLGYVYGNLMVNVQPKNSKLLDRARRIVAKAAGVDDAAAADLLAAAGNSVRTAIVMAKMGAGREAAEQRLAEAGGRISKAL